jgi:hypothetical protein
MTTPTKTRPKAAPRAPRAPKPVAHEVNCPHCKKVFSATVDLTQPPRLQGAKCPNCKLFVPARLIPVTEAKPPLTKAERARRG